MDDRDAGAGDVRIEGLWIYPVRSIRGIAVRRAEITPSGSLLEDREWLVVDDAHGELRWQGHIPCMALLQAHRTGDRLGISNPAGERVEVDVAHEGPTRRITQHRYAFTGVDAGDEAATALSDWMGEPVRLIRLGEAAHTWGGLKPVHVVGDRSLAAINELLAANGKPSMEIERFRPNVLLGVPAAWEEERRKVIDFGPASLRLREPAVRCVMPSIDRTTAAIDRELLRPIALTSRDRATASRGSFGVYSSAHGRCLELGMTSAGADRHASADG